MATGTGYHATDCLSVCFSRLSHVSSFVDFSCHRGAGKLRNNMQPSEINELVETECSLDRIISPFIRIESP